MNDNVSDTQREIVATLAAIIEGESKGSIAIDPTLIDKPLIEFGVTSLTLMTVLIAAEERYAFEWPSGTPREVFRTLRGLSGKIVTLTGSGETAQK
jgi:hypothetical protein